AVLERLRDVVVVSDGDYLTIPNGNGAGCEDASFAVHRNHQSIADEDVAVSPTVGLSRRLTHSRHLPLLRRMSFSVSLWPCVCSSPGGDALSAELILLYPERRRSREVLVAVHEIPRNLELRQPRGAPFHDVVRRHTLIRLSGHEVDKGLDLL